MSKFKLDHLAVNKRIIAKFFPGSGVGNGTWMFEKSIDFREDARKD